MARNTPHARKEVENAFITALTSTYSRIIWNLEDIVSHNLGRHNLDRFGKLGTGISAKAVDIVENVEVISGKQPDEFGSYDKSSRSAIMRMPSPFIVFNFVLQQLSKLSRTGSLLLCFAIGSGTQFTIDSVIEYYINKSYDLVQDIADSYRIGFVTNRIFVIAFEQA